jgi:Domain of unknown function (DUF6265)
VAKPLATNAAGAETVFQEVAMRIILASLAAVALHAAPVPAQSIDALHWLAGDWVEEAPDRVTEEMWMAPRAGVMLGMSRTLKDERLRVFEFVRIGPGSAGGISFFAQPGGTAPTEFPLLRMEAQLVTFANPGHDYPAIVRYWRDGEQLLAEISAKDGSNPMRWRYRARK